MRDLTGPQWYERYQSLVTQQNQLLQTQATTDGPTRFDTDVRLARLAIDIAEAWTAYRALVQRAADQAKSIEVA